MRELRALVTPEDVKRVWDSQRHRTPRTVARALGQAGRKVPVKTIMRRQAENWIVIPPPRHPLEVARDMLDAAIPLLTGDPTSTVCRILRMQENAEKLEMFTEDELYRQRTRALRTAVTVVSLELARRTDEFTPDRIGEYNLLFATVTLAFKASLAADDFKGRPS